MMSLCVCLSVYVNSKLALGVMCYPLLPLAHHGNWVPCGPRLNCEGSRSSLEPQRYSVRDPPVCGHALALTNLVN